MSSASQTEQPGVASKLIDDSFISSIESVSEGDIEVISNESEALIDPHNLSSTATATDLKPVTESTVPPVAVQTVAAVVEKPLAATIEKPVVATVENKKQDKVTSPSPQVTHSDITVSESWFLQLGSFSVKKNAQALQKQVSALNYQTTIQASESNKGTRYRVRIGPDSDKTSLEKASKLLNKKLRLQSQIVKNSLK